MRGKISLPGLLLGAITALAAGLLVSHYSFAWLLIGVAVGMVVGVAVMRRGQSGQGLQKGEQQ
jgi:membrane protease YdiL (CAAX protease family)